MLSLILLSLAFIKSRAIDTNLVYVEYPKSFQDARKYCQIMFGTDLASIVDDEDRTEAISIIPGDIDDVWIGLYSQSDDGVFRFVNDDECPMTESAFRCVDFWSYTLNANTEERPRCIGPTEGGTQCATFDASQNSVDNDIGCDEPKPFLCEERVTTSYSGQYIYIPPRFGTNWNFIDGQAYCESQFGTDLATILTEDDQSAAKSAFPGDGSAYARNFAIIGLNDIAIEGQHEWVDGTPCEEGLPDGRCSSLWDIGAWARDDISDQTGQFIADCVIFFQGSHGVQDHFEISCDSLTPWAILCNAPLP